MPFWSAGSATPKHTLIVTASSNYDDSNSQTVPINTEEPISINSDRADIELVIRIKDFEVEGNEEGTGKAPDTSAEYFNHRQSTNVSLQISFTPKIDMAGDSLLFGNDFAYPIRDFLPYGTGVGLKLFKNYVDPSVDGDVYADEPFLYGKALTSFNAINDKLGPLSQHRDPDTIDIEEDLSNDGDRDLIIPTDPTKRQKFFQNEDNLKKFTFLKDKTYQMDFFSGFVSLQRGDIQISLPGGFELNMSSYLNGKFDSVRFVLKIRDGEQLGVSSGEPLLIVNFRLTPADDDSESEEENDYGQDEDPTGTLVDDVDDVE